MDVKKIGRLLNERAELTARIQAIDLTLKYGTPDNYMYSTDRECVDPSSLHCGVSVEGSDGERPVD